LFFYVLCYRTSQKYISMHMVCFIVFDIENFPIFMHIYFKKIYHNIYYVHNRLKSWDRKGFYTRLWSLYYNRKIFLFSRKLRKRQDGKLLKKILMLKFKNNTYKIITILHIFIQPSLWVPFILLNIYSNCMYFKCIYCE
jgi:hypothetical protein